MPTPPVPEDVRRQRKEVMEQVFKDGYHPVNQRGGKGSAVQEAARRLGVRGGTIRSWLASEETYSRRGMGSFAPDESLFKYIRPKVRVPAGVDYVADPEQRPRVRVRAERDDNQDYYIVAIGDAHDAPGIPDKSRFRWAGAFVKEHKPDVVVQIGDFFTFDSISQFAQPGSLEFKETPTFPEDIASAEAALTAFDEGADGYECDKLVTCGNHEDRLLSFESRTPQIDNMLSLEFDRLLGRHNWTYSLFAQPMWFGGVGFNHIALTIMGRPMGGELTCSNMALKAVDDWVVGHTHRAEVSRRPKLGGKHVTCINLGSYLPTGHVEHYIKHGTLLGWTYSLFELRISKGRIQSYRQHTVEELREGYG